MKNRGVIFCVFCVLGFFDVATSSFAQPSAPPSAVSLAAPNIPLAPTNGLSAINEAAQIQDLTTRVLKLEIEAGEPKSDNELIVAVIGGFATLFVTLIGGFITLYSEHRAAQADRDHAREAEQHEFELAGVTAQKQLEQAEKQALFQQTEKMLDFRIKQMEDFYAPMFALLKQSTALYQRMGDELAKAEPARYKVLDQLDAQGNTILVLGKDGGWKGFRLLEQMPVVRKNAKAFELATGIIKIGKKTTKIISLHAGLASADLVELLGEYLAHYALLSTIYHSTETEPSEPIVRKSVNFSQELIVRIENEYREISNFLDAYGDVGQKMLADMQKK